MKYISWNVNGLRAVVGKNFREVFAQLDADFVCLQETKMQEGQLDLSFPGYQSFWNYAEKKGYSGTAIYTRHQPVNVTYGMGIEEHDHEGRVITLEMADHFLVCVYTPNSQDGLKRLNYRMTWEDAFRDYLIKLDKQKPVIVCGDMNHAARQRIHRHVPPLLSRRDRPLQLVELSFPCQREERGLAYRLLPCVGASCPALEVCRDP